MAKKDPTVEKTVQKILKEIPRELLELFYSEKLPEKLVQICSVCRIEKEEAEKIAFQIGKVLMGGLAPEKLLDALKKEAKLPSITAIKLFQEIDKQIFSSVRESLDKLYKKRPSFAKASEGKKEIEEAPEKEKEVLEKITKKEDIYREPIE